VPKRKYREATTVGTDGVVVQIRTKHLKDHPVRSLLVLRDFFNVAATPPVQEGQWCSSQFIHTFRPRSHRDSSRDVMPRDHRKLCDLQFPQCKLAENVTT
jgi:hypothetical protein